MNFIIGALILIVIGVASPGPTGISPETLYSLGIGPKPPPCRLPTAGEARERGLDKKGKVATYTLDGEYICERGIFDPGDRSPYEEFVLREMGAKAADVARAASLLARKDLKDKIWQVEVRADPPLRPKLKATFEAALAGALGTGAVARAGAGADRVTLRVATRNVQDADILFDVTAASGGATWRL